MVKEFRGYPVQNVYEGIAGDRVLGQVRIGTWVPVDREDDSHFQIASGTNQVLNAQPRREDIVCFASLLSGRLDIKRKYEVEELQLLDCLYGVWGGDDRDVVRVCAECLRTQMVPKVEADEDGVDVPISFLEWGAFRASFERVICQPIPRAQARGSERRLTSGLLNHSTNPIDILVAIQISRPGLSECND